MLKASGEAGRHSRVPEEPAGGATSGGTLRTHGLSPAPHLDGFSAPLLSGHPATDACGCFPGSSGRAGVGFFPLSSPLKTYLTACNLNSNSLATVKCPAVQGEEAQRHTERGVSRVSACQQGRGHRSLHARDCLLEKWVGYPESNREPQQSVEQRRDRIRCVFIKH